MLTKYGIMIKKGSAYYRPNGMLIATDGCFRIEVTEKGVLIFKTIAHPKTTPSLPEEMEILQKLIKK